MQRAALSVTTSYMKDANCKAAWYMNNNGGNETDRSGNNETLTQTSGTIPTSATVPTNYLGTSRDFEASQSEYLTHADGGSTDISGANQPISLSVWYYRESDTGAVQFLISKYGFTSPANQRQYYIRVQHSGASSNPSGVLFAISSNGEDSGQGTAWSGSTIPTGSWTHIAGVYNDIDMRVYVNGVLDPNGAKNPQAFTDGIFDGSAPFAIGCEKVDGTPEDFADGLIDEVIIFDRALSATEVSEIYTNGISGNKGGND